MEEKITIQKKVTIAEPKEDIELETVNRKKVTNVKNYIKREHYLPETRWKVKKNIKFGYQDEIEDALDEIEG